MAKDEVVCKVAIGSQICSNSAVLEWHRNRNTMYMAYWCRQRSEVSTIVIRTGSNEGKSDEVNLRSSCDVFFCGEGTVK